MLQMLQNFQKKRERKKKHAYVAKPTERAELSIFAVLLNVADIAEFSRI